MTRKPNIFQIFIADSVRIKSFASSAVGFSDKAACISFWEHVEKKESKFSCHPFPLSSIIIQHYGHQSL